MNHKYHESEEQEDLAYLEGETPEGTVGWNGGTAFYIIVFVCILAAILYFAYTANFPS